jgi:hypothetical protein
LQNCNALCPLGNLCYKGFDQVTIALEENAMKERSSLLAATALLLALAACSSYVQRAPPGTPVPPLAVGPTSSDVASDVLSEQVGLPDTGALEAPMCQASETCAALNAEQIPLSCVKKVPYTNVLVPLGTTFQVLDDTGDFMCLDSGVVVSGKEVLTCHGAQLYSFQLRLSNTACTNSTLALGTGHCDEGYGYDATQRCCAPLTGGLAGSTTVSVNLGACPPLNP